MDEEQYQERRRRAKEIMGGCRIPTLQTQQIMTCTKHDHHPGNGTTLSVTSPSPMTRIAPPPRQHPRSICGKSLAIDILIWSGYRQTLVLGAAPGRRAGVEDR